MASQTDIDVLAVGEVLVDFISTERSDNLRDAHTFRRYLGGSPANIAVNVSRLGKHSAIVAKTGIGAFGQFLKGELSYNGVNTDYLLMDHRAHTSFIFVSRTSGTPDFEPSRDADYRITPEELPEAAVARANIVHTSTWPLSRQPSRAAAFKAVKLAYEQGKTVSFDPNYSPVVWPDYQEAKAVMRDIYQYVTITKASLDDSRRFFGEGLPPEAYIQRFHELGPQTVVFTLGKEGSLVSENGRILGHLPARAIEVKDATGAGDAFWSGFLVALLDGYPLKQCLLFAREVVELKLKTIGTLPNSIPRQEIYASLPNADDAFSP